MKCQVCKQEEATWAWQPFGPGETANEYTLPGNHYRGFPIIKVGESCKNDFEKGDFPVRFTYKGHTYIGENHQVREVDASLWLGEECVPSELDDAPAIYLNRDTAKGIDVAAIVYQDNADLIPLFLSAPQLVEACETLEKYRTFIERYLEYAHDKEEYMIVRLALSRMSLAIDTLHENQGKTHA
jgi:hypothetical protein